jgi:hypothetical protein
VTQRFRRRGLQGVGVPPNGARIAETDGVNAYATGRRLEMEEARDQLPRLSLRRGLG